MGMESELMTTSDAAECWGITPRRVQILCDKGKVTGAFRMGKTWIIPKDTPKPIDGRTKASKEQQKQAITLITHERGAGNGRK